MSSDSGTTDQRAQPGVLRGPVRSMSGKQGSDASFATDIPTTMSKRGRMPNPSEPLANFSTSVDQGMLRRAISTSSSTTEKRLKIGERLKKLGRGITAGKLRKNSDKSVLASPRITVDEVYKHNSVLAAPEGSTSTDPRPSSSLTQPCSHANALSELPEIAELNASAAEGASEGGTTAKSTSENPPESSTLAKRIQTLIDSLPFPTPNQKRSILVVKDPKSPGRNEDGLSFPLPDATLIQDSNLINFLSDPTIMNGSTLKGRPSIWNMLEKIRAPTYSSPLPQPDTVGNTSGDNGHNDSEEHSIYSDNSSVMVYSPLIPTLDDEVELAELVPVESEGVASETPTISQGTAWSMIWPLSIWYGTPSHPPASFSGIEHRLFAESTPKTSHASISNVSMPLQTVRAWVPSNTKLSVQAMWWGYRIYLPPPVLEILSDKTLEATKRASMITTALTWFFNHLPVDALPPPLRPAALLLQRLAPFLGYIGTFISWSWSTIKSYDIGFGVTLTATWLLPVALIPGTWRENDFPKSPNQSTIPLPSTSSPSSYPSTAPTQMTSPPTPVSPALSYVTANETITSSGITSVVIPVPPTPMDIPPVPPSPISQPVAVGSPLMNELLQGPVLAPVPLPDEDSFSPSLRQSQPLKKNMKNRTKALFTRSP